MNVIDKLLQGSIDTHIHFGPDPRAERRLDVLQGARQAQEAGMRAIVLKSHEYPTAPLAYVVSQIVPNIGVFGSISLDFEVGGVNPSALEASAKLGAKVVWMPTLCSAVDMKRKGLSRPGISIVDGKGKLLPVVGEVLDIVKRYNLVLATGHISTAETFALIDEARNRGIWKMVVTHPMLETVGACSSLEEQRRIAEKGAFIEITFGNVLPLLSKLDPLKLVAGIKALGVEHCFFSTDLGQLPNPTPVEGMRMMIAAMLGCGFTEKEVELMAKTIPARLLGLD